MKKRSNIIVEEEDIDVNIPEDEIDLGEEARQNVAEHEEYTADLEDKSKAKSPTKKFLLTVLFVLINAVAIMATALMDFGGKNDIEPFSTVWGIFKENGVYALIALCLFLVALFSEGMKRFVLLKASLRHRGIFGVGIRTAVISKYYDYITPFGSGGQPMEIYYMRKKGVPGSIASGITVTCYALGLFATVFVTAVMLIWKGFLGVSPVIEVLAIIGLVANVIVPLGVLVFSIMPKVGDFLVGVVAKILKFLHLTKDVEAFKETATKTVKEYARCIIFFFGKYSIATFLVFFFGLCYNVAIYSVPYFIIRMCGVTDVSYFEVFTLCLICFSTVTIFPTPGNSGAAEISFYSIFSSYLFTLGSGVLFWGVLSWRVVTYYLFILSGVILMIAEKIVGKKRIEKMEMRHTFKDMHNEIEARNPQNALPPPDRGDVSGTADFGADGGTAEAKDDDAGEAEDDDKGEEKVFEKPVAQSLDEIE